MGSAALAPAGGDQLHDPRALQMGGVCVVVGIGEIGPRIVAKAALRPIDLQWQYDPAVA